MKKHILYIAIILVLLGVLITVLTKNYYRDKAIRYDEQVKADKIKNDKYWWSLYRQDWDGAVKIAQEFNSIEDFSRYPNIDSNEGKPQEILFFVDDSENFFSNGFKLPLPDGMEGRSGGGSDSLFDRNHQRIQSTGYSFRDQTKIAFQSPFSIGLIEGLAPSILRASRAIGNDAKYEFVRINNIPIVKIYGYGSYGDSAYYIFRTKFGYASVMTIENGPKTPQWLIKAIVENN